MEGEAPWGCQGLLYVGAQRSGPRCCAPCSGSRWLVRIAEGGVAVWKGYPDWREDPGLESKCAVVILPFVSLILERFPGNVLPCSFIYFFT